MPRHVMEDGRRHGYAKPLDGPPPPYMRGPAARPPPPHPALLEEEVEMQHREIRRLLSENRGLMEDHVGLQRELAMAKDEMHRMGIVIADIQVDKEAHTRELIEKGLKLEADLRATEPLKNEVVKLRAEVQKLSSLRQDLTNQVQSLTQELNRKRSDNQQIPLLKSEIDGLRQEIVRAR